MCEPVSQKYSEELYDVPERLQRKHCTSVCVYTWGITLGKQSEVPQKAMYGINVQPTGPGLQTDEVTPAIDAVQVTRK